MKAPDHCLVTVNSASSLDEAKVMETLLVCSSLLVVDPMPSLGRGKFGEREREKKGGWVVWFLTFLGIWQYLQF